AAYVTDDVVSFRERTSAAHQPFAHHARVSDQPTFDEIQRGQRGRAAHRVATEGRAMRTGSPGHYLLARDDRADRHPRAKPFGGEKNVRLHIGVLAREHPARASDATLDFVRYEHDAVPVAQRTHRWEELRRRHDVAALALNRLDDNGGHVTRRHASREQLGLDGIHTAQRAG